MAKNVRVTMKNIAYHCYENVSIKKCLVIRKLHYIEEIENEIVKNTKKQTIKTVYNHQIYKK